MTIWMIPPAPHRDGIPSLPQPPMLPRRVKAIVDDEGHRHLGQGQRPHHLAYGGQTGERTNSSFSLIIVALNVMVITCYFNLIERLFGKHQLHLRTDLPVGGIIWGGHVVVGRQLCIHWQLAEVKDLADTAT